MTRVFDILFSAIGLIILSPIFLIIAIWIKLDSKGAVLYKQKRVGKNGVDFMIYKFRSMHTDADKRGLLTVGGKDSRVTGIGHFIRKYKIDELPQLLNVIKGDMSIVGPRPEVRKYVDLYTPAQQRILEVRPGITDVASVRFKNENELLGKQQDPEKFYIECIMPAKLKLNMLYIESPTVGNYFRILWLTVKYVLKH